MIELTLHGKGVPTVFNLLGENENDMTYSLGWVLSHSQIVTEKVLEFAFKRRPRFTKYSLALQESHPGGGYTDVEIQADRMHLIIEAKKGWNLPSRGQLERYSKRLRRKP